MTEHIVLLRLRHMDVSYKAVSSSPPISDPELQTDRALLKRHPQVPLRRTAGVSTTPTNLLVSCLVPTLDFGKMH